ncbi:MAG: aminotransferase class V-fold PLP-dependent enzyme [Propionibacteriaceae bacterium]|nr:aminotransferase class V-fold PLP-dependent enzyme [Propionibacteriaceae bacterium]
MGSATAVQTFGVARLAAEFEAPPGYLAAASTGILPRPALAAMVADLERSARGQAAPADYDEVVADTRQAYAALVDVPVDWVATASQTSTLVANVAAGLPDGAEVLVGVEEFASVVLPFTAGDRLRIRTVPLATLAESITTDTALVAFSLVQSATGEVLPGAEIAASARRHGALTLVDLTQAAGALPVRAGDYDFTVCHTYKWLCTPRGVAFLTICPEAFETVVPVAAGWYSADEPWRNCYWPDRPTSRTARVFDTAPAWEAFVGARASISMFATADQDAIWAHASGLADRLCRGLGRPELHRAIVSWPDPGHRQLAQLTAAGMRASGPLGLIRLAFHVWNTEADVDAAIAVLR